VQTNRLHGRVARVQLTGSKMTWKAWGNFSRFQAAKKMMIMTTTMEKRSLTWSWLIISSTGLFHLPISHYINITNNGNSESFSDRHEVIG
jgi:hypothetical protein